MEKYQIDLEEDDVKFMTRSNKKQTLGTWFMLIMVLAGLSGLLGYGYWTKKNTGNAKLSLEYEYFLRPYKETPLKIFFASETPDSVANICLGTDYLQKVDIIKIFPQPLKTTFSQGKYIFSFPLRRGNNTITFTTRAVKAGNARAAIGASGKTYFIDQFIYP